MTTLAEVREVLEGALPFGPQRMHDAVRGLLTSLPRDGAIVSVDELAWAMHAELCDWKYHTTVCWDTWQQLAAKILAAAQEN
ncbi:MAG: hypothetical protein P4M09_00065 [Devosia sp.]|nr:hypothetical protein [Devosia sp.]